MSFRKTGAIAGIALLLGGIVSANAATANPDAGVSPRATSSYSVESSAASQNTIDYGRTSSIEPVSGVAAHNQTNPYAQCLGQSTHVVSAYSCQQ